MRLETESSGLDLQAFICTGVKPQDAVVSRERKYRDEKKKRKKSRMIGTYAQGKREKWNSILRWSRMHSVTVYTFGE